MSMSFHFLAANYTSRFKSVHHWHLHVHEHKVGITGHHFPDCDLAILGDIKLEPRSP